MAFGSSDAPSSHGRYSTLTLGHTVDFIEGHLDQHWKVLRHTQFKHPALGLFMVLGKARREAAKQRTK